MRRRNGHVKASLPGGHQGAVGLLLRAVGPTLLATAVPLIIARALMLGQQPDASSASAVGTVAGVVHVLGLENVKRGAKGTLTVQARTVQFDSGKGKADVGIPSIQDVFTDQESQQLVRGKKGTLAKLAMPYESGRALSLLSERVDVLTLEYQDSNGGLHGVILQLPKGRAAAVKKELLAKGAHTSVPVEEPAK